METAAEMNKLFSDFSEYIRQEQDLKEKIRDEVKNLEHIAREITMIMQNVHQNPAQDEVLKCCNSSRASFATCQTHYAQLAALVPVNQFYHFNDMWRFATQKLAFLVSLTVFLETGKLASFEEVAESLGLKPEREKGFHLDLEDYLTGLLQMASELARFATNSVTSGNYDRPIEISKFVSELNAGFRLLNLKNDSLRKKFDALKYDVKKIEEIVYDVSIRGLRPAVGNADQAGN
ncbi:translin isoform X2 [Cloeon dipterum]|uniref:translin isoform X2 n=1 Tax=Cloeon dipterum TaxID=197152 RepID=UPI00321FBDF0